MSPTPPWAAAVQGLWDRVTGGHRPLHLAALTTAATGSRAFEVRDEGAGVRVAATDGVSACVGIHRYLRDACGVRVTWDTALPLGPMDFSPIAPIRGRARVESFYYLNFCTFGYSTAWWDWPRWERELDWMALQGVTMPLNLVGHEATLALAYSRMGMTDDEIRSFLGGPAYLPWLYMGCLDSFAGPLPVGWIPRHLDLGRRILDRARAFGMTPVLPAFTGHVPRELAPAGARTREWQGMETRVVDPDDPLFRTLTAEIVTAQRELFGTDHLYAADPFIEMRPSDDHPAAVATAIVEGLWAADADAVWVLQSWPFSYQGDYWTPDRVKRFLDGIPAGAVVVLDLWAEAAPQAERLDGFFGRPWIWTGLLNFGGRSEPVADLESTARNLEAALAADRPPTGLGLSMEAIHINPVFYELIADRAWDPGPSDVDTWIRAFGQERYGVRDPAVADAWSALRASVLNGESRSIFPERFISVAVSRPEYTRTLAADSTLHDDVRAALFYEPKELLHACRALPDADRAFFCVAILVRVIDHRLSALVAESQRTGTVDPVAAQRFLDAFDDLDAVASTRPSTRLSTWVGDAERWAEDAAGRQVLVDNARRLVTVWNTVASRSLDDYSARIWGGLVGGYHRRRWELWLTYLPRALDPDGRPAAQEALDAELDRVTQAFITDGSAYRSDGADVRTTAALVLDRYGEEFSAIERAPR
ncbi:alpha-N-acetylglucosaminidase [Virgisporangium aurantiacum]|uniref:Alpha-N-acetylglucosaminidase n=1 Tax=Virgisporangium aurantiacum TaxID=175570 RepID=A0A8J3ZHJ5_9ACTN|nr:alpha-N-acetylglucosaminidase TIM-barrel domain-containing protein [Virgisporangium aurantiacum]GIJ64247.1 alpha-N-acetylglucosaminidase [Virgisporangium aurantiacum]